MSLTRTLFGGLGQAFADFQSNTGIRGAASGVFTAAVIAHRPFGRARYYWADLGAVRLLGVGPQAAGRSSRRSLSPPPGRPCVRSLVHGRGYASAEVQHGSQWPSASPRECARSALRAELWRTLRRSVGTAIQSRPARTRSRSHWRQRRRDGQEGASSPRRRQGPGECCGCGDGCARDGRSPALRDGLSPGCLRHDCAAGAGP